MEVTKRKISLSSSTIRMEQSDCRAKQFEELLVILFQT